MRKRSLLKASRDVYHKRGEKQSVGILAVGIPVGMQSIGLYVRDDTFLNHMLSVD